MLTDAAKGIIPSIALHDHPNAIKSMNDFIARQFEYSNNLFKCQLCSERWFKDNFKNQINFYICKRCSDDDIPHRFTSANNMDPFYMTTECKMEFNSLPSLSAVEKRLIALRTTVQSIYRIKGGSYGCSGHVVNLIQDLKEFTMTLPQKISNISITIVRKRLGDTSDEYKDFKVSLQSILSWLQFLKKYNPLYQNIILDFSELESLNLPRSGGSIFHQIPSIDVDEILPDSEELQNEIATNPFNVGPGQLEEIIEGDNVMNSVYGKPYKNTSTVLEDLNKFLDTSTNNNETSANDRSSSYIDWPSIATTASCEYSTPHLLAGTWPHLFPCGIGDYTDKTRLNKVNDYEATQHYLKYCICTNDGSLLYPFVKEHSFLMYIQDLIERKRIMSQANVYIAQNVGDANMTINQLKDVNIRSTIMQRMHRYSSFILGSPSHLHRERKRLEAIIKQLDCPTIWFTLSFADKHWQDLHRLFGYPPNNIIDEETLAKWKCKLLNDNPHIVNAFFVKRIDNFIKQFFGENCLESNWTWYRFEWQKRGVIHCHLLARLKSDPGIASLAKEVYKGRIALRKIFAYNLSRYTHVTENNITNSEDMKRYNSAIEQVNNLFKEDKYKFSIQELIETCKKITFNQEEIETLEDIVKKGNTSEKQIITYRDYILTSINPMIPLPSDANKKTRDPKLPMNENHASSICYRIQEDGTYNICLESYPSLINHCYRHRCTTDYCKAKGTCRFHFPRSLQNNSHLVVDEMLYKNGPRKGSIRRVAIKFESATNDSWLNSHCKLATVAWGGMVDLQMLVDYESVIYYIAKYGTKTEQNSKGLDSIIKDCVRKGAQNESTAKTIIRSAFIKASGGREKCIEEVTHLLLSIPIVVSSHSFVDIRLNGMNRIIDNTVGDNEIATSYNILDAYAKRMDKSLWMHEIITDNLYDSLGNMNLTKFASKFRCYIRGPNKNKIDYHKNNDIFLLL